MLQHKSNVLKNIDAVIMFWKIQKKNLIDGDILSFWLKHPEKGSWVWILTQSMSFASLHSQRIGSPKFVVLSILSVYLLSKHNYTLVNIQVIC